MPQGSGQFAPPLAATTSLLPEIQRRTPGGHEVRLSQIVSEHTDGRLHYEPIQFVLADSQSLLPLPSVQGTAQPPAVNKLAPPRGGLNRNRYLLHR
ncbi:MAG: hypothetical protein WD030_07700 [Pirellulales bacterium]